MRTATTPWLPSVASTRWSSWVQSRFLMSNTVSVPQRRPSSSIGVQSAERRPNAFRSGGELRSKLVLVSTSAVTVWLSITAPTMPCPLVNSIELMSAGKPVDMITRCVPSAVVRVSSAAVAPVTRVAASSVFCSRT